MDCIEPHQVKIMLWKNNFERNYHIFVVLSVFHCVAPVQPLFNLADPGLLKEWSCHVKVTNQDHWIGWPEVGQGTGMIGYEHSSLITA